MRRINRNKDFERYEENRIYGVVTAIVTNNKDPENMGRIKVKFPWMGEAGDKDSNWVRVATLMAGNERGSYFLPEVDDEVLIAFENGDINYPYMIGALWNGKDAPVEQNSDGKNNIRVIKSRSGHTLMFNDKDGEEVLELRDKSKKRYISFKVKDKYIEIHNEDSGGEIKIVSKGKITVSTDDAVLIEAKKDIDIKTQKNLNIDAANINIKSKQSTKIDASAKVDITSKAPMKLESKGLLDIKAVSGSFKASAKLDLQSSGIASLKGSITKLG